MKRVYRKRLTDEQLVETLINKMFEIAGHKVTYNDIRDRKDDWFTEWTMTVEQNEEWVNWLIELLRKERKYNKMMADKAARMYSLMWGLKFSDFK